MNILNQRWSHVMWQWPYSFIRRRLASLWNSFMMMIWWCHARPWWSSRLWHRDNLKKNVNLSSQYIKLTKQITEHGIFFWKMKYKIKTVLQRLKCTLLSYTFFFSLRELFFRIIQDDSSISEMKIKSWQKHSIIWHCYTL